jgi:hypothetical protein
VKTTMVTTTIRTLVLVGEATETGGRIVCASRRRRAGRLPKALPPGYPAVEIPTPWGKRQDGDSMAAPGQCKKV